MSDNTLVAQPQSASATSGTFLGADLAVSAQAIGSGSWQAMGLAGVATTVDLAATVADPFGALLSAGFGWLMDHINPLKKWLEDLTGSPAEVEAYAKTWENIAARLESEASDLTSRANAQLETASGEAIEAYRTHAESLTKTMEALAKSADGVGAGLTGASQIIDVVHGIVRDVIAQICAAIVEWAAELVFSFGLATPLVIEQATSKVAAGVSKVTGKVTAVVESCQKLEKLLQELSKAIGHVRSGLDKIHPGAGRGSHERGLGEGPRPHGKDSAPEHPSGDHPADNGNTRDPAGPNKHAADPGSVGQRAAHIAKVTAGELPRSAGEDGASETTGTASKAQAK